MRVVRSSFLLGFMFSWFICRFLRLVLEALSSLFVGFLHVWAVDMCVLCHRFFNSFVSFLLLDKEVHPQFVHTGGLGDLKRVCGIIAARMKDKPGKEGKFIWGNMIWKIKLLALMILLLLNIGNPLPTSAWLRDKLVISNKSVYFIAIVLNMTLRLAWMQSVLQLYHLTILRREALTAIVACLEILRRGIWNFFRLENEHLNNVGKYRAFKSVPLPFNYDDEEKDA